MGNALTEKNRKYAEYLILDGCTKSEAYRRAYPEESKELSPLEVSRRARSVDSGKFVQEEIKRLQSLSDGEAIITRRKLLSDVSELIERAKKDAYAEVIKEDGTKETVLVPKVAEILIKAIDRAAKMIGADEPEEVSANISVSFESDEFDKYAELDGQ